MNNTPRVLNRILIGLLGLKLLAVGVLLLLLATVPAVGQWWQGWSSGIWNTALQAFARTRLPGRSESWLWMLVAAVLALVIGLVIAWVAQQGKGRADLLLAPRDDGDVPGTIRIAGSVAEQAIRGALAGRTDLAGSSVAVYSIKGKSALRIRLQPRQGVAPQLLASEVAEMVQAMEKLVGQRLPVLIHIRAGARTRLSRAERVR